MPQEPNHLCDDHDQAAIAAIIADQNDRFRRSWGTDITVPGRILVTRGVADLSTLAQALILQRVQTFESFTKDNDPYGDHTFGAFKIEIAGQASKIFWKIDLYDTDYVMGSDDPADVRATRRFLTIMLACEY